MSPANGRRWLDASTFTGGVAHEPAMRRSELRESALPNLVAAGGAPPPVPPAAATLTVSDAQRVVLLVRALRVAAEVEEASSALLSAFAFVGRGEAPSIVDSRVVARVQALKNEASTMVEYLHNVGVTS